MTDGLDDVWRSTRFGICDDGGYQAGQFGKRNANLGGGNSKDFWNVHPCLGKIPILTNIFQLGWNHQLEMFCSKDTLFGTRNIQVCDFLHSC